MKSTLLILSAALIALHIGAADTNAPAATRRVLPKVIGAPPEKISGFPGAAKPPGESEKVFAWDALEKKYTAKAGETEAKFTFSLTNISAKEVVISDVRTSCGCTIAKLPSKPWPIPAGASGTFGATVDLKGKSGLLVKTVTVESDAGERTLQLRIDVPPEFANREANQALAKADRQAVFRGDCMSCHVIPALAKKGKDLYTTACGVCHEAEHRASMVPDLHALKHPVDAAFWRQWVESGKENTLMPAFAKAHGGPLDPAQIDSLVEYLDKNFKASLTAAGQ